MKGKRRPVGRLRSAAVGNYHWWYVEFTPRRKRKARER